MCDMSVLWFVCVVSVHVCGVLCVCACVFVVCVVGLCVWRVCVARVCVCEYCGCECVGGFVCV